MSLDVLVAALAVAALVAIGWRRLAALHRQAARDSAELRASARREVPGGGE